MVKSTNHFLQCTLLCYFILNGQIEMFDGVGLFHLIYVGVFRQYTQTRNTVPYVNINNI